MSDCPLCGGQPCPCWDAAQAEVERLRAALTGVDEWLAELGLRLHPRFDEARAALSAQPAATGEGAIPYGDQCRSCGGHKWITPLPSPNDNRTPPAQPCPSCGGSGRTP